MKLVYNEDKRMYTYKGKNINFKEIATKIRQGEEIHAEDEDGFNITQETLVKVAFHRYLPASLGSEKHTVTQALEKLLTEEQLYDIIEKGCIENFLIRR